MGNICSRSSNASSEAFSTPGRVLGSNPPDDPAPRAPLPSNAKSNRTGTGTGTGRTVGSASGGTEGNADPRTNAALAAQKRAETVSTAGKGKLGTKLAAQKAQTQTQTLNEASRDEVAARDADGAAEARRWQ
ncbi:hypothetical protein BO78DRAFT_399890 [Aspergillus sclerotiicarbonarius CBS 121057]|uniref:Uncharacterized protein n=1 Tax=Aspergillus sclerotiicarbonarius (strain CBS 121057 / IBT 28362) TaxID=1448318 RepID=A0A319DZX9_ASPSB|nr:hypothetical protein BO78DRAFT_399890 [Aspergillus sclerotiicarbonarius CBS 121057]